MKDRVKDRGRFSVLTVAFSKQYRGQTSVPQVLEKLQDYLSEIVTGDFVALAMTLFYMDILKRA